MLHEFLDSLVHVWTDITGAVHAPLGFRLIVQPLVAIFFAIRGGRMDAREGRPPYLRAVVTDAQHRRALLRDGWKQIGKVFVAAVVMDVIYQLIVERRVYPSEAIMVGAVLAVLPYLVVRGLVNRILRHRQRVIEK